MLEKAKWIEQVGGDGSAPVFRKKFQLENRENVTIAICGLGFYTAKVNGKSITEEVLMPPFTTYDERVLYQVYDLTDCVVEGENVIEVTCGNGWFNQEESDGWSFNKAAWKASPKMICEILVDGKTYLVSDSSWEVAGSRTTFNSHRGGETYEAGKEIEGFGPVKIARGPGGILEQQTMPGVKVLGEYEGVEIYPDIYDFGQSITGNVEITVEGKPGELVEIFYSERIRTDGSIDRQNVSEHVYSDRFAKDMYFLKGDGVETWHSDFGFHGFRYVLLYNPSNVKIHKAVARDMHTDLQTIGGYTCSDPVVNQLHQASVRSLLTNYVHIPMDCPHREKNGWTADAMLSSFQALYNLDMKESYYKWLDDIVDCQRPNGAIPCIAPTSFWGYQWGSGSTWDAALFVIPWNTYLFTGDLGGLVRYYPALKRYLEFLETQSDSGIFYNGLGDWCNPPKVPVCEDRVLVTCYAKHMYDIYAKISAVIGNREEEAWAKEQSQAIREAFIKEIEGKSTPCQTYYACLLYFDMTDDKEEAAKQLAASVREADGHIQGGIFGAFLVPLMLRDYGYFDLAWEMVTVDTYPGWVYLMNMCHGTIGECWLGQSSLDHHMFTAVDGFIHGSLSGLREDRSQPGMRKVQLKPYFPKNLENFSAWYDLPAGRLEIAWDQDTYRVQVPEGILGTVELDGREYPLQVGENSWKR